MAFSTGGKTVDAVNKTLYIPLYGKSFVSKRGILLHDPKAEEIWQAEGFPLKGKSASKWLSFYMGMRAAVFDRWVEKQLEAMPASCVLHLGCGMDSRCLRVEKGGHLWYDIDFPDVIAERKKYYAETENYRMVGADVRNAALSELDGDSAIVVMEGITMYLKREELQQVLAQLRERFSQVALLMDCYTDFAAKASRYKNPINEVGVTEVYGLDDPRELECTGLCFVREHDMTPRELIDRLQGMEKAIFSKLYAGAAAKKMYRMYEFRK